ncbi:MULTISPECIES: hypothetical protein [unclassified Streptomyces]|uniref:hypothetical protein n=1 Tax=unclassified Streptomyces TaxID=2593676 RepID=UPI002740C1B8|nr:MULTISPECIES: hypothetical protein [unclassified Streptomyces]
MNEPPVRNDSDAAVESCGMTGNGREFDPGRIADAVAGCGLVSRVTAGPFGASAYLPGGRVPGIEVSGRTVRVHVVAWYGHSIPEIVAQVRDAVVAAAPGAMVDVVVEDLDLDAPPTGESAR